MVGKKAFRLVPVGLNHLCRWGSITAFWWHQVTEGPDAGKLALLDFGLVAEVPRADREAMVSATIHLGNRDWDALITDFIALGFLPVGSDRRRIIPVMDKVLSPYLRGGGARSFNFQVRCSDTSSCADIGCVVLHDPAATGLLAAFLVAVSYCLHCMHISPCVEACQLSVCLCVRAQMLSQDLLQATLEIPFSVPPYMSLLARAVATLEGIALTGDPNYQMVAQACHLTALPSK